MLNISWLHKAGTGAPSWSKTLTAFPMAQSSVPSSLVLFVSSLSNLSYPTQLSKCHTHRTTALRGVIHRLSLLKLFTAPPLFHCSTPVWSLYYAINIVITYFLLLYLFSWGGLHTRVRVHTHAHPWYDNLCFCNFHHAFFSAWESLPPRAVSISHGGQAV